MKGCSALGALVALSVVSAAKAEFNWVDLGTFRNDGLGQIDYAGNFGAFVSAGVENDGTAIEMDLAGVLELLDEVAFIGIRVIDTGDNQYGVNSAGADIDLFTIAGLSEGNGITYSYEGPTPAHQNEISADLATRMAFIDHESGAHEWTDMFHVSLGKMGMVTAMLSDPQGPDVTPGGLLGGGPRLRLGEAGVGESFRVQMATAIPTPGSAATLCLGLLMRRPGRRRRT
ncbi:MAG: hypothetical protein ACYTGC_04500 [Planctomycetota bacterium]|jgi:hypothetical protein